MITIKAGEVLGNQLLQQAFGKLQQAPVPYAVGKHVMELGKSLDKHMQELGSTRLEIVQKYANKDAEGKAIINDGSYDIIGKEKEVQDELKALFEQDIEIALPKIDPKNLSHARLTPQEWEALGCLIGTGGLSLVG